MRTINTVLPIYDSVDKQDKNLVNALTAVACPRHRLPAFQFEHSLSINSVDIVDCDGNETDISTYFDRTANLITGWTNSGYDTFTSSGADITSCVKSTAAGAVYAYSNSISVESGDVLRLTVDYTENSGTAPNLYVVDSSGNVISNVVSFDDGRIADFKITATDASAEMRFGNADGESVDFELELISSKKTYFPHKIDLDTDYIQYTGGTLNTLLPKGSYYLRLSDSDASSFYSEYFIVDDVYPNLISAWGSSYDTSVISGTTITSAITSTNDRVLSDSFDIKVGENIMLILYLILNSGQLPVASLVYGTTLYQETTLAEGLNIITFTGEITGEALIRIGNTAASNFSTNEIVVIRNYSEDYIRLDFSNTNDIPTDGPTILYSQDFVDTVWLATQMGVPAHETIRVGSEKNGTFIPEKIISVYTHQIVDYIGRSLYRALARLPLHDSISIVDTVGNDYNPSHDITVAPLEWSHFDIGTVRITFNENGSIWTNNLTNLT